MGRVTGDANFYLKIMDLMQDYPGNHPLEFEKEWAKAVNRFKKDFLNDFVASDGGIDWIRLLQFNSGKQPNNKKIGMIHFELFLKLTL